MGKGLVVTNGEDVRVGDQSSHAQGESFLVVAMGADVKDRDVGVRGDNPQDPGDWNHSPTAREAARSGDAGGEAKGTRESERG